MELIFRLPVSEASRQSKLASAVSSPKSCRACTPGLTVAATASGLSAVDHRAVDF